MVIHTEPFVPKLIQYSMKAMTTQHNKADKPKTGQVCQTTKIQYQSNFGGLQN